MGRTDHKKSGDPCLPTAPSKHGTAFTNYGVSVGLQAVDTMLDRVDCLDRFFVSFRSGDEYDTAAITHVMACSSAFPGALLTADRVSPAANRTG